MSGAADWHVCSSDETSCASCGWPITRRRDLAHCGYRHSKPRSANSLRFGEIALRASLPPAALVVWLRRKTCRAGKAVTESLNDPQKTSGGFGAVPD